MSSSVDRAAWLAQRQAPRRQRRWSKADLAKLRDMIGQATVAQMAAAFGRPPAQMAHKLNMLGYSIPTDISEPLGLNLRAASKRLGVPYEWLWHRVRRGEIKAPKKDKKDYLMPWREYKRVERQIAVHQARRARWLARIKEPTITKKQFDQMIGLSEVQCSRYLKGKIVRAWKIPMPWAGDTNRDRWEWRVSKRDAERVTRLRAEGKLRLRRKEFRALIAAENAKVTQLRKARRLGKRDDLRHAMSCVVPGCYSIRQVASHVGLSESQVYSHIQSGRLAAEHKRVGARNYVAVRPEVLPAYVAWCKREKKATGPIHGRASESQRVLDAGYLTVVEACRRYPDVTETQLRWAVASKRIPSKRIGRMIALKQKDVRTFVKLQRCWTPVKETR